MGLFSRFKKEESSKVPKGFYEVSILALDKVTADCVKISFDIPSGLKKEFEFKAGQFIELLVDVNGKEERRDYSICSGKNEPLSIAVKAVEGGNVSKWLNEKLSIGSRILISHPHGNFTVSETSKNIVAIAAGSGITPILAIAKDHEDKEGNLRLYYGSRTVDSIIFKDELAALKNTFVHHQLSGEEVEDYGFGRMDRDTFTNMVKNDLSILRADEFFICGPEQMIFDVLSTLKFFGVAEKKIRFELFAPSNLFAPKVEVVENAFEGIAQVSAILDGEKVKFELPSKGKDLLKACEDEGLDAPYNCRGAVCSSCRAKVLKGSAMMTKNYTLTDEEVAEGYILTCQAHPTSEELIISFDE